MKQNHSFRITDKQGRELGEGSGPNEVHALLNLHRLAGHGRKVRISKDGTSLSLTAEGERSSPRERALLVDVKDCTFERLA